MNVKFGIFADLHTDFIHDSVERVKMFLDDCNKEQVDFCIQLGDFCPPNGEQNEDKTEVLKLIKEFGKPFYHVLGNHDMDSNSKEDVLTYINATKAYYSFDYGEIHFVVLDACYYAENKNIISYDCGNYKNALEDANVPIIPVSQLQWLKEDLIHAQYPTILFSHQSLIESRTGIRNPQDFRAVAEQAPKGVLAAVCGHEHIDRLEQKNGIWYWCVNSMSYYWAGSEYQHSTYSKEITAKYPKLEKVFPYLEPLYAVVEITNDAMCIKGKGTKFVGSTPKEMKFQKQGLSETVTASISDKTIGIR